MKKSIATLCFLLAVSPLALAQSRDGASPSVASEAVKTAKAKREPSAKQKAQRQRMKDCNKKAKGMKGAERKKLMKSCLKG